MVIVVKIVVAAGLYDDVRRIGEGLETCLIWVVGVCHNTSSVIAFDAEAGLTVPSDLHVRPLRCSVILSHRALRRTTSQYGGSQFRTGSLVHA